MTVVGPIAYMIVGKMTACHHGMAMHDPACPGPLPAVGRQYPCMLTTAALTATTRVGNALGAGDSWQAKCSCLVSFSVMPLFCFVIILVYALPSR